MTHPLLAPEIVEQIERSATEHRGSLWTADGFTDLNDRASHPCGIFRGQPFSVFAKLAGTEDGHEQFTAELAGLELLHQSALVAVPVPVGTGTASVSTATDSGRSPGQRTPLQSTLLQSTLLLTEALDEHPPAERTRADWQSIGRVLAALHRVQADDFGLPGMNGFFGPLRQDNTPVPSGRWADFYAQRRLLPYLRLAVDRASLPPELAAGVERVARRLPGLAGPEPRPALLHGDAQQHNYISTPAGPVVIDAAPYYGHPELDLALLDYFHPVPADVLAAYRELQPVDPGLADRRELWRLAADLAVIACYGSKSWGRVFTDRLSRAVRLYR